MNEALSYFINYVLAVFMADKKLIPIIHTDQNQDEMEPFGTAQVLRHHLSFGM